MLNRTRIRSSVHCAVLLKVFAVIYRLLYYEFDILVYVALCCILISLQLIVSDFDIGIVSLIFFTVSVLIYLC